MKMSLARVKHFNDVSNEKAHRCLVSIITHFEQMQPRHLRSDFHPSQFSLSLFHINHSVKPL